MSMLFVFDDGTIIDASDYELWQVEVAANVIDNVDDLQFAADRGHATKMMRVEKGNVVYKHGDGPAQMRVLQGLPKDE